MSLWRRAKRRDETEPAIVKGLRQCGYQVLRQDFPDLLVRHPCGELFVLEVQGITKYRKRSEKQLQFLKDWQVPVVRNIEEAMASVTPISLTRGISRPLTPVSCLSTPPGEATSLAADH